jgi:ABC-type phosphate transport system permease subunit
VIGAYQIEMIRRNNIALRAFNASADRWSRWLVTLTVVLLVFTLVLVVLARALLDRGA